MHIRDEGRGKATSVTPAGGQRLIAGPCESLSILCEAGLHPWEAGPGPSQAQTQGSHNAVQVIKTVTHSFILPTKKL